MIPIRHPALALALALVVTAAIAQSLPSRTVRIVVPTSPSARR